MKQHAFSCTLWLPFPSYCSRCSVEGEILLFRSIDSGWRRIVQVTCRQKIQVISTVLYPKYPSLENVGLDAFALFSFDQF